MFDKAGLPLLMMELMKTDLHKRLIVNDYDEDDICPLTIKRKFSILLDVAEGLEYLHTHRPPVIHRDLTARNVLLDQNDTAKIGDFGNSRILNIDQTSYTRSTTGVPGTLVYTAPEALETSSSKTYDEKIDIFSYYGHLTLFAMINEFPGILEQPVKIKTDGTREAFSEVERRNKYIDKLKEQSVQHCFPLIVTLVTQCLDNIPQNRPHAKDLIAHLESL